MQTSRLPDPIDKEAALKPRRLRFLGVGLTATACAFALWQAERLAADVKFFGKKAGKPTASPQSAATEQAAQQSATNAISPQITIASTGDRQIMPSDKQIKLKYFSKSWDDVMRDVAQQRGR